MIYVDSSALVKLVVEEPESTALRRALHDDADQVTSSVAEVEVLRAVRRAVPELLANAQRLVSQIALIEVSESIRARAARLEPGELRSLDAIHLATALEVGEDLGSVITYDVRMAGAARQLGLGVIAPQ